MYWLYWVSHWINMWCVCHDVSILINYETHPDYLKSSSSHHKNIPRVVYSRSIIFASCFMSIYWSVWQQECVATRNGYYTEWYIDVKKEEYREENTIEWNSFFPGIMMKMRLNMILQSVYSVYVYCFSFIQ